MYYLLLPLYFFSVIAGENACPLLQPLLLMYLWFSILNLSLETKSPASSVDASIYAILHEMPVLFSVHVEIVQKFLQCVVWKNILTVCNQATATPLSFGKFPACTDAIMHVSEARHCHCYYLAHSKERTRGYTDLDCCNHFSDLLSNCVVSPCVKFLLRFADFQKWNFLFVVLTLCEDSLWTLICTCPRLLLPTLV